MTFVIWSLLRDILYDYIFIKIDKNVYSKIKSKLIILL